MTRAEILTRLRAATGPDRELDAEVWLTTVSGATRRQWSFVHSATGRECQVDETRLDGWLISVPELTASIDAALALVEEILPGWDVTLGTRDADHAREWPWVQMSPAHWKGNEEASFVAWAPTLALAVCIALFEALEAQP